MERRTPKQTQKLVDQFNKQYPVGAKFRWRRTAHEKEYEILHVQAEARDNYGQAIVWCLERAAFVSIDPDFVDYEYHEDQEGQDVRT